jgi:hypothetical protein
MQYLVSVIDNTTDQIGRTGTATSAEMAAIDVFNDRLMAEGHWVFAGGLASPGTATVIDNRGEEAIFTDGPYLESKEYLAGFWVMEAPEGGSHPLPGAARRGSAGPRRRRTRRPLPRLQRGLPSDRPGHRSRTSRPNRRGDPAHSHDPCPHAAGR